MTYSIYTSASDMLPYIYDYGEVCVYCHTPHGSNNAIEAPLWNRATPTGSYTIYTSSTMDNTPTNPPSGISLACLSCHDGTIGVDEIRNPPSDWVPFAGHVDSYEMRAAAGACGVCHYSGNPFAHDASATYLTTDLSDDHPISMDYPTSSEFNPPTEDDGWGDLKLYAGKVECASCHSVHDPAISPFLRISNSGSALCTKCHIK